MTKAAPSVSADRGRMRSAAKPEGTSKAMMAKAKMVSNSITCVIIKPRSHRKTTISGATKAGRLNATRKAKSKGIFL